ncbi:MAG TPA: hypothetical protein VGC76_03030 [Pyrinomonadaceae bacterium]|jgi:WD40 repeat protein
MKKILIFVLAILFLTQISNAQNPAAKNIPLRIQDNPGSNGWSPDGKLFVTYTRSENKTKLWNLAAETAIWEISLDSAPEEVDALNSQTFIWSKSQKLLLAKDEKGEIYLLDAANGKVSWQKKLPQKNLEIVNFSPDEKRIVLVFSNKTDKAKIEFRNVASGKLEMSFDCDVKFFDSFSYSRDGGLLKFGSFEGKAVFIAAANGKTVKNIALEPCGNLKGTFSNKTVFSPDFNYLVARCRDKTVITDTVTGKVLRVLKMKTDFEKTLGFSGNGKILILQNLGYEIFKFSNRLVKQIDDLDLWFSVDLNYDGSLLMNNTDYRERGYEIAEVETGKVIKNFENHPGIVKSLDFSFDGKRFAAGSTDRILRVWDARTKELLLALAGHTDSINSVKFSADAKTITSKSENETIVWDAQRGRKISEEKSGTEETEELKEKVVSPGGNYILEGSDDEKPFRLVDAKSEKLVREFSGLTQIQGFRFTPDEKRFLSAAYFQPLQLWDVESGQKLRDFDIGYSSNNVIVFSPDGKTFVTGGENQNILMYELGSGKLLWSLFSIDREQMRFERASEARRVKYLQDKADYEQRADLDNRERSKKITVKFSHYGTAESFWEEKIAETGAPNKSKLKLPKAKATVAWFALTNDSDLPVSIDTNSMYFNPKCRGLCDGAEISSRYSIERKNGETGLNGFDMYSKTVLPPQTTVYFSVALEHLMDSKDVYLGFTFQKDNPADEDSDDYGTERKLYIRENDLPE